MPPDSLGSRNNTEIEEIVAIDSGTGERIAKNTSAAKIGVKHACGFSDEETRLLNERTGKFETLHNHPNSSLPSRDDIVKLFQREKQSASNICGHDGRVYRLEKIKDLKNIELFAEKAYSDCIKDYGYLGEKAVEEECSRLMIRLLSRAKIMKFTERR